MLEILEANLITSILQMSKLKSTVVKAHGHDYPWEHMAYPGNVNRYSHLVPELLMTTSNYPLRSYMPLRQPGAGDDHPPKCICLAALAGKPLLNLTQSYLFPLLLSLGP